MIMISNFFFNFINFCVIAEYINPADIATRECRPKVLPQSYGFMVLNF